MFVDITMENENKQFPYCIVVLITVLLITSSAFIFLLLNPTMLAKTQNYVSQFANQFIAKVTNSPSPILTDTPTVPTIPLPTQKIIPIKQGEEIYSISQGKTDGPKITKAIINPHDPKEGIKQTVTIFANHTKPISWVKVTVYSDNKTEIRDLALSSGTSLSGTWSGSWTTNDTHLHKWGFLIESGDTINQSKVGIAIR
ncbi:MAG TPA: hypothetical protein VLH94_00420 [Spirochaetia bacterium]|nr:hypothetical protein [Spirochaetia bacterium]